MSSTRLSGFLDGLLEAGWLAAIVVTPLFFNIYSSRVFEPDKLTTLRSIALVMAAAWLVRWVEERTNDKQAPRVTWRTPLVIPTLFTVLVYLVSTAFSVTRYISFFGSYQRLQGTFTTLSYIVIFFIILDRMRTRAQVDRLVTTLILNSLPIALYGFVQHARRDPLPWGGDVTRRIASNMGNAIFVAAYLIMAVPPTLARVADSFRSILRDEETGALEMFRAATYVFIFLVQVIAVFYTKSRGPLMGLLFGLGVWVLLGLIILQRRARQAPQSHTSRKWLWMWVSALTAMIVLAILFFFVNPGGPLHEWAQGQPAVGRLARVLEYQSGTGMVRNLIWQGALDLILPHDPIEYPETVAEPQQSDQFNAIRPLVGYGPESMIVAYNRFYPPLLGHYESRTASPDRSHNETLDSLVMTGLLGFAAYLWLFGSLFYFGLRWLGLLPGDWRRTLFFALLVGGAALFVAWTSITIAPHFFGLAIPVGMMVGLILYLLIYGFSAAWGSEAAAEPHPHSMLLVGIFSTFVAHFVEINFGISIAATRTTFWALAGMFVLLGLQQIVEREKSPVDRPSRSRRRRRRRRKASTSGVPSWLWPCLGAVLIGGLIMGTLAYDFVSNLEQLSEPGRIVWRSLTIMAVPASRGPRTSLGILMVFGMTWGAMGLLTTAQMVKRGEFRRRGGEGWAAVAIVLTLSLAISGAFALALAERHAHVVRMQRQTFNTAQQLIEYALGVAHYLAGHVTAYYFFLGALVILGGLALAGERARAERWATPAGVLALLAAGLSWAGFGLISGGGDARLLDLALAFALGSGAAALVGLAVYRLRAERWTWIGALAAAAFLFLVPFVIRDFNLHPIQADITFKQGDPWERQGQWYVAVPHYQRAVELAPREDHYYLFLGRAFLEYASSFDDPTQQSAVMQETERVLLQAQAINPLNTDHSANLARMYRRWSTLPAGGENQQELAERSNHYYEVATTLSPNNVILWNEWAMLYRYVLGDDEGFQRCIEHSLELDPGYEQTWLLVGDVRAEQGDLEGASDAYSTALEIDPRQPAVWSALGRVHLQLGRNQEAIEAFSRALELAPGSSEAWDMHRLAAIAYYQAGFPGQAQEEAQLALQLAPENQRPAVEELIQQMQRPFTIEETSP
ncbi:MAG: tetratricopeptide repeat protein [Anaerolineae bacterium]|jgi:tetratricopeptide (TPR) repeat protein